MSLRHDMLKLINFNHLGIEKCKTRVITLFWPNMCKQSEELVSNCVTYLHHRKANQKERMTEKCQINLEVS